MYYFILHTLLLSPIYTYFTHTMDIIFDIDRFNFFAEHLTREYRVRNNPMELYELVIIHKHTFIILIIIIIIIIIIHIDFVKMSKNI